MQNPVQYTQQIQDQNADLISVLPTNQYQPSHNELRIVDTLFKQHGGTMNKIVNEAKDSVFIGILFIILSMPQVDESVKKLVPMAQNSPYILILVKALILIVAFWLIKNFWLSRKDN